MDGHKKIMFAKCVNQFMIRLNNKLIETLKKMQKSYGQWIDDCFYWIGSYFAQCLIILIFFSLLEQYT